MIRAISEINDEEETRIMETPGMVTVGEMPARDREFDALLRGAAQFQKTDIGCRLMGEAA